MKRERVIENVHEHDGAVPRHARAAARPRHRRRPARDGLLLRARARQGQGDAGGFTHEECETLLRGFLSPQLFERGLICRADDRGDPVIQISPPLIAGAAEIDEIAGTLGDVLTEAQERMHVRRLLSRADDARAGHPDSVRALVVGPGASARPSPRSPRAATSSSASCFADVDAGAPAGARRPARRRPLRRARSSTRRDAGAIVGLARASGAT